MKFSRRRVVLVVILVFLLLLTSFIFYFTGILTLIWQSSNMLLSSGQTASTCPSLGESGIFKKTQPKSSTFGAITKFDLPTPSRDPNSITVEPDGSVWFGEQAVPGVGHLYPNGTLAEYAWPFNYNSSSSSSPSQLSPSGGTYTCPYRTSIWGIAVWNGRVWASDVAGNQLVGLDPKTGSVTTIKLPIKESFPYTMTTGPEGSLWFTELYSSQIGRVLPNGTLLEYPLQQNGKKDTPSEIIFVNSTLGYYVSVGGVTDRSESGIYSFNPQRFSSYHRIEMPAKLASPDSIAFADDDLWIVQHGPSIIVFYDLKSNLLVPYPASTINYTNTVLPFFIKANGSANIWFNEHYGNRIARINSEDNTLTEYNLSNKAPKNITQIDNAVTFALGKNKVWFTAWTANYIGFVDASYRPSFSVQVEGDSTLEIPRGSTKTLQVIITGQSSKPLLIFFSDSESFSARPQNVTISSNISRVASLNGEVRITLTVTVKPQLQPRDYMLLVTASDGLLLQSAYIKLHVPLS